MQIDSSEVGSYLTTSGRQQCPTEMISVVIPTYKREEVLIDTLEYVLDLSPSPYEVLVIDQTVKHTEETESRLKQLQQAGSIQWIKLEKPSITEAMNLGLQKAVSGIVLFLDDDIIPHANLIAAHLDAHREGGMVVAGQVLQPGDSPLDISDVSVPFRFNSVRKQLITEFIGCNFSVARGFALSIGGFDQNFVHVAYRYEAEFSDRALAVGRKIFFAPEASVRHLKAKQGGTRSFGHHLRSVRPSHSVGAYYFLLRSKNVRRRLLKLIGRPLRSVRTKHHATHPWWIPVTLAGEGMGFIWAVILYLRGPRLLEPTPNGVGTHD